MSEIGEAIRKASLELTTSWTKACEAILVAQGADPRSWVLVTQQTPDGQNAWAQRQNEPVAPRYPMVQIRFVDTTVTVRIVETPT